MGKKATIIPLILLVVVGSIFFYVNRSESEINKVVLPESFVNILSSEYTGENNEFIYCLDGVIEDGGVAVVEEYYKPEQSGDDTSITANCGFSFKSLGTIHSHPNNLCYLSQDDAFAFGRARHLIAGVVCGDLGGDIYIYTTRSINSAVEVELR